MNALGQIRARGKILPSGAEIVSADAYPAVLPKHEAARFIAHLKSEETSKEAEAAISSRRETMHNALSGYVTAMKEALQTFDVTNIFAQAHEIRGLAEMAGLGIAGKIANGLCLYIDALDGGLPDRTAVELHVEAIERVVRGEEAGAIAHVVAEELTALVIRKLGESKALGLAG